MRRKAEKLIGGELCTDEEAAKQVDATTGRRRRMILHKGKKVVILTMDLSEFFIS
jgi:hypothetical protein